MKTKTQTKKPPKRTPPRAPSPAPSTIATASTAATAPSTAHRTEGQRRLAAVNASLAQIAKRLEMGKSIVHMWIRGEKVPAAPARAKLAAVYGIPPEAWERAPGTELAALPAPAAPVVPPKAHERSALAQCLEVLDRLDEELRTPGLTSAARRGITSEQAKMLSLRVRLEREEEMFEDRVVRDHPFWKRLRAAILEALEPYPDASRAVAAKLLEVNG